MLSGEFNDALTPIPVRSNAGELKLVPEVWAYWLVSALYTMKGCASDPPNATPSGLIKPGLRPGPWELYGARCQASEVVSHAPTAMALTISEGGCTRHSGHAFSASLPTEILAQVRAEQRRVGNECVSRGRLRC